MKAVDVVDRRPATSRPGIRYPLALFLVVGSVLWAANIAGYARFDPVPEAPSVPRDVVGGWLYLDSVWYIEIAEHGYTDATIAQFHAGLEASVAFFPSYPLTVRAVATITQIDVAYAALLTTALCGLGFVVLFYRWCSARYPPGVVRLATAMLVLYPYSWFLFGTGYGDALFLLVTIAAFMMVERDRYLLAGLFGIIATAARPVGPAVAVALLALVLERSGTIRRVRADPADGETSSRRWRWRVDRERLQPGQLVVLVSIFGFLAWCAFLWARAGDPLAFLTVQEAPGWEQPAGPATWFKFSFFRQVAEGSHHVVYLVCQAIAAGTFLAFIPRVASRLGWAYALYTLLVIGIPLVGSADFQGIGRYMLAAFPVLIVAADWLYERRVLRALVLNAGAAILLLFAVLFSRGFYIS
jgi:hypothetical protein